MSILTQLSSSRGDRSETSNRNAALLCINTPEWIAEIAEGLGGPNPALAGDCAEVMTQVAEDHPELVMPYAEKLIPLLADRTTRVRWEIAHALALISQADPAVIGRHLPALHEILLHDASIIVRDYLVDSVGNYAASGKHPAEQAFPTLVQMLVAWDGKQAGHALQGLLKVARQTPDKMVEIRESARPFLNDRRGVVRKAAKVLLKAL
ncbi:MAG: hypothetical protein PHQ40_10410 [Anaerolineaceae bacterium]|nr:hypothetical protein [Anaerolineaceae bacterium]